MSTIKERVQEIFDRFAVNLSVDEIQMATALLDSGQEIQTDAEAFGAGASVFVVNDEGERIPLPDGDYTLEDGTKLRVVEGVVTDDTEDEAPAEEPAEEELAEAPAEQETLSKQDVADMIKEAIAPLMEALEAQQEATEKLSAQSAQPALPRVKKAPQKTFTPVDLSKLSLKDRVSAIQEQFQNNG